MVNVIALILLFAISFGLLTLTHIHNERVCNGFEDMDEEYWNGYKRDKKL